MAVKRYNPTSPGRRHKVGEDFSQITKEKPEKKLLKTLKKKAGRNQQGRISVRHRGGGSKRKYRKIDFFRDKDGIKARVAAIEYDPNRSAHIALLQYKDGEKRYISAPDGLSVGDQVMSGEKAEIKVGNCLPLRKIPMGQVVHNIELVPQGGAKLVRSAGASAQVIGRDGSYLHIRMPSKEIRAIHQNCRATIGHVGNSEHGVIKLGKAGATRHRGRRPHVRGSAMNPNDHPHGGGEGRTGEGMNPKTPWGKKARGKKTRRNKRTSRFIIRDRREGR